MQAVLIKYRARTREHRTHLERIDYAEDLVEIAPRSRRVEDLLPSQAVNPAAGRIIIIAFRRCVHLCPRALTPRALASCPG